MRLMSNVVAFSIGVVALAPQAAPAAQPRDGLPVSGQAGQGQAVPDGPDNSKRPTHRFTVVLKDGADGEKAARYFRAHGFRADYDARNSLITLAGSYAQVEASGHFRYAKSSLNGTAFFHAATKPRFGEVDELIEGTSFVLGPNANSYAITPAGTPPAGSSAFLAKPHVPSAGYTPADYAALYDIAPVYAAGITGTGQTVDIAVCQAIPAGDLDYFDALYNLPQADVQDIQIDGTNYYYAVEPALDVERVHATAPGAQIRLFTAPNCRTGSFVDLYAAILQDQAAHPAAALTISYGLTEGLYVAALGDAQLIKTQSTLLRKIAATGVTIFAASGDSGSFEYLPSLPNTAIDVSYPASDFSVLAVGGTTVLTGADGGLKAEYAWSGSNTTGSGGGVSAIFGIPRYQIGIASAASQTYKNLPDFANNADPYTGAATVFASASGLNAEPQAVGGTSAASPTMAGIMALIAQARQAAGKKPLRDAGAAFYRASAAFRDISAGDNGYFKAGKGYDNVTGIGAPDVARLINTIK